jgi:hypothetical protein
MPIFSFQFSFMQLKVSRWILQYVQSHFSNLKLELPFANHFSGITAARCETFSARFHYFVECLQKWDWLPKATLHLKCIVQSSNFCSNKRQIKAGIHRRGCFVVQLWHLEGYELDNLLCILSTHSLRWCSVFDGLLLRIRLFLNPLLDMA